MTTKTETAIAALVTALGVAAAAASLPAPGREERSLDEFTAVDGSNAGIRWLLFDGTRGENDRVLGSASMVYELTRDVVLELAVSSTDLAARLALFDAALSVVSSVIGTDPTLGGAVSDVTVEEDQRSGLVFDGAAEIKATSLTLRLLYWSDQPF